MTAAVVACLVALGLARVLASCNFRVGRDGGTGLQKIHAAPTPRLGGLAVATGLVAGWVAVALAQGSFGSWPLLFLCVAPGFAMGLIEDLSKRGAIFVRLALTGVSAALGYVLLDARISGLGVPGLDALLAVSALSFVFTVFAVMGVGHAMNIIDGLNGLAGWNALLASAGLAIVAWSAGDSFVFPAACVIAGSVAGFLVVNYPRGAIFLGDGGAYLLGLLLAELSVILVHRNSDVSPWFPLILLAYPVWETIFSIYRRRSRGCSPGRADALHLHSLVYRRVVRWKGPRVGAADYAVRNSIASLCLWAVPAICCAVALAFWGNSLALQWAALVFAVSYALVYRRIVRFGVPPWLVVRAKVEPSPELESARS